MTVSVPNMVEASHAKFGMALTIEHLTAFGSERLDSVVGIKPEGGIAHVRSVVVTKLGVPITTAFQHDVIQVPMQLLLITDTHGIDITAKFLVFALEFCDDQ